MESASSKKCMIRFLAASFFAMSLLAGCQLIEQKAPVDAPVAPTPTVNPIFLPISTSTVQVIRPVFPTADISFFRPTETMIEEETPVAEETQAVGTATAVDEATSTGDTTPTSDSEVVVSRVPIYDEKTNSNWVLRGSESITYIYQDPSHPHSGSYSIALQFNKDGDYFDFVVRQGAPDSYLRDGIYGVSFWLYSANQDLALDDLGVGISGSNAHNYWALRDNSVDPVQFDPFFDWNENNYLLGFNRALPADTWTEVEISLNDLKYDTDYEYVTGIRFRNNAGYHGTILIDDLALLQIDNPGE